MAIRNTFNVFVEDNGMLDLWDRQLRRASKVLRSDPVTQKSFYGGRLAKLLGYWTGAVVARNFAREEDSKGRWWNPLSPATITHKNRDSRGRVGHKRRSPTPEAPLRDSGEMFKALTPAGVSKSGRPPKSIAAGSTPTFNVSPSAGKVVVSPRKVGAKKNWDLLFAVHNQPVGHSTTAWGGAFKRGTGGKRKRGRQMGPSSYRYTKIPGREFFYFKKEDLEFMGLLLSYAALVGGPVDERGNPLKKGQRGRAGTKADLNRKAPTISQMITHETERLLKTKGVIDMIRGIS